jgi:serine protease Do
MLRVHPAQQLPAVQWGDSTRMLPGMPVIAIGNPLGLGFTVTHGIVSARDRDIRITELDNFIQIDAAINPGNSGGPLFNISGELVGMNTAFFTPGEERGSVGLGFAVPGNELQFVVNELRRYGRVRLGTIGVEAQDLDQDMADAVGLPRPDGVVVFRVAPGTPADTAGLRVGDIILTLAGRDIANVRRLRRTVAAERIGATVPVEILRDGARLTLPVTIAEAPIDPAAKYVPDPTLPARARPAALGLAVAAIPPADRSAFGLSAQAEGVVVTHVMPKTIATDLGLAAGNVILRVNGHDIGSPAMLAEAIDDARARGRPTMMMLLIDGKGVTKWMAVPVPPAG